MEKGASQSVAETIPIDALEILSGLISDTRGLEELNQRVGRLLESVRHEAGEVHGLLESYQRDIRPLLDRPFFTKKRGRPVLLDEVVRQRIALERISGKSMNRIAKDLEADGVKTATGKDTWHPSTVGGVLKSLELEIEDEIERLHCLLRLLAGSSP